MKALQNKIELCQNVKVGTDVQANGETHFFSSVILKILGVYSEADGERRAGEPEGDPDADARDH